MQKKIKYLEGQWFAIPLLSKGYAIGIIVRGSSKTHGGLGYFFGPNYITLPDEAATLHKQPHEAILIRWFGNLGLITGAWPLIGSSRPFRREDWPVPVFGRKFHIIPQKGWKIAYNQNDNGDQRPISETLVDVQEIIHLPEDGVSGAGAIEIRLTHLLS